MNTSKVTSMARLFSSAKALKQFPALDTSSVTDMTEMFKDASSSSCHSTIEYSKDGKHVEHV